jgi:hypothetical protein
MSGEKLWRIGEPPVPVPIHTITSPLIGNLFSQLYTGHALAFMLEYSAGKLTKII